MVMVTETPASAGVRPASPSNNETKPAGTLTARLRAVEAPTWALIAATYGGFAALTYWWQALPLWVLCPVGAYLVCLHAHLAHEILHGHPTRVRWVNELFAWLPLSLWLPYPIYRDSHMAHHGIGTLTCPVDDPESFYHTPERWAAKAAPMRALLTFNQSFLGRMTVGPLLLVARFWTGEVRRFARGNRDYAGVWALHLLLAAAVMGWIVVVCGMPAWLYILGIVYPGTSLMLLRSYVEHKPGGNQDERCAIVEGSWLTQLLFLNNNFHLVHHTQPGLPWYEIPRAYRADRTGWLARNGGYRYRDYLEVARRHFIAPKDSPIHPAA